MKKKILTLALIGLLVGIFAPMLISAQGSPDSCNIRTDPTQVLQNDLGTVDCMAAVGGYPAGTAGYSEDYDSGTGVVSGATCCLFSTLLYATRWMSMLLMVVVVLLIIMGAFNITTSGGDADKIGKGRDYIIYALVGLAVALLAFGLPYIIREIMGF